MLRGQWVNDLRMVPVSYNIYCKVYVYLFVLKILVRWPYHLQVIKGMKPCNQSQTENSGNEKTNKQLMRLMK